MRVRLERARVLVRVLCVRRAGGRGEVGRVAEHEAAAAVQRQEIAADAVADEAIHAVRAVDAGGHRRPVADREQVVLAVLQIDLRTLGLIVDTVRRQQRRQELPLGQLRVRRDREADIGLLIHCAQVHHRVQILAIRIVRRVAEIGFGAGARAARAARVALEHHVRVARMRGIGEHERIAERVVSVLLARLVHLAFRLQQRLVIVESREPYMLVVRVDVTVRARDDRDRRRDVGAAGRRAIERQRGVVEADVLAVREARGAGPLGVVRHRRGAEHLRARAVRKQMAAPGPAAVGRTLRSRNARAAIEEADARMHVAVVERVARVRIGAQREDHFPALVAQLVRAHVGERPGIPYPYVRIDERKVLRDVRHRQRGRQRVLVGARRVRLLDELAHVRARPAHREMAFGIVGLLRVRRRRGAVALRVRRHASGCGERSRAQGQTFVSTGNGLFGICHEIVVNR